MPPRIKTFFLCLGVIVLAGLAFYAGSLWSAVSMMEVAGRVTAEHDRKLAIAARNDAQAVANLAKQLSLPALPPGGYQLRIQGRDGERILRITVRRLPDGLHLLETGSQPVRISEDGIFFDWQGDQYGMDHYVGLRTENGVFGRVYFSHGFDVGVELFWIEPVNHDQPPGPPRPRRPRGKDGPEKFVL